MCHLQTREGCEDKPKCRRWRWRQRKNNQFSDTSKCALDDAYLNRPVMVHRERRREWKRWMRRRGRGRAPGKMRGQINEEKLERKEMNVGLQSEGLLCPSTLALNSSWSAEGSALNEAVSPSGWSQGCRQGGESRRAEWGSGYWWGEVKQWPEIVQGICELSHPHRSSFSTQIRNSVPACVSPRYLKNISGALSW